jgi:SAM-dependent methyltransferase
MNADVEMPGDWDDHAGWEAFYQSEVQETPTMIAGETAQPPRFLDFARSQGMHKIWFAGNGLHCGPLVYAHAGFDVLATDVSETAIHHLLSLREEGIESVVTNVPAFNEKLAIAEKGTTPLPLRLLVHDFRESLPETDFDLILNLHAFQGLPTPSRNRATSVFFSTLKPGGYAIFDTMNVQGERRDKMESSLTDAGFYLPYHQIERWYRQQLAATGIPYNMVLGRPFVARGESQYEGEEGKQQAEHDRIILQSFNDEYRKRLDDESPNVEATVKSGAAKVAYVVYNTG